jgi:uroporphyrin-3 C-methyltransferase/uroporphyrinogen III methyltransferase/synthase
MNDNSSPHDATAVDGPMAPKESSRTSKKSTRVRVAGAITIVHGVLIVLAILLLLQWWSTTNQMNQLREELARRLQAADVSNAATQTMAKTLLETDKQLQVKFGVLESEQAKSESHALALQQLYQDLSKNRDDWALAEIEQVLSTASQQLQLAGNVPGALIALQNADARLAGSDKPQFITIRRAISHDIDRLKALPNLDLPGIALRLDSAIEQVDSMPLLVDETPAQVSVVKPKDNATKPSKSPQIDQAPAGPLWKTWLSEHWERWSTTVSDEARQLIRIRDVSNPEALLIAPSQAYFIKENVKLRLLNARLALLSRNEVVFKSDLASAQHYINRYFDTRAKQTKAVQALLKQIQHSNLSIEMPSLAESLNAVRHFSVKQ